MQPLMFLKWTLSFGVLSCRTEFVHPQVVQMESEGDPIVLRTNAVLGEEEDGDGIASGRVRGALLAMFFGIFGPSICILLLSYSNHSLLLFDLSLDATI